jgi:hypothetical protein
MANRETWTARVEEWRASGLTVKEFSAEKGLVPGTLSWWSSRLLREAKPQKVQLARVVRLRPVREQNGDGNTGLVVEVGAARLMVPRGVDPLTLEVVLRAVTRTSAVER